MASAVESLGWCFTVVLKMHQYRFVGPKDESLGFLGLPSYPFFLQGNE